MSSDYDRAISFVLAHEGEWSDHAADRGGRTRWGISERAHRDVDLDSMTRDRAVSWYRAHYWTPISGDALPEPLDLAMLDYAVHAGAPRATRALQRILGVPADGVLGPKTLAAIQGRMPTLLALGLVHARARALTEQIRSDPTQLAFLGGWWARLIDLAAEIA